MCSSSRREILRRATVGNFSVVVNARTAQPHPLLMLGSSSSSAPSSPDPCLHFVWIRSMSTRRANGGALSRDFHDLMLSQNIAQSHHTLPYDEDPQPSQGPSISSAPLQNTSSQHTHIRESYGRANQSQSYPSRPQSSPSRPQSSSSRPSFNHSSKGVTAEFKQVRRWSLSPENER